MVQKTVLITGATRGIGLAFVQHYVNAGWNVIAAARSLATADTVKAVHPSKVVQLDVGDEESITRAAEELDGVPIDLLINNVGICEQDSFKTATKEALLRHFDINAIGPLLVTRALLENLRLAAQQHGEAVVVSISSLFASIDLTTTDLFRSNKMAFSEFYSYRSSKAALNMVTSSVAADLEDDKVIAIVFHPGHVSTDMNNYTGVITASESVEGMVKVLSSVTAKDSGKFFDYLGEELAW